MNQQSMTPREITRHLDEYIIGQDEAKRAIAIALRNRYRRLQLDEKIREEVTPKNIMMIGSTGVGKTEIARRMAKMMNLPFVKVEASKYTEVGFVGRDVESMVRDLVSASIHLVESECRQSAQTQIQEYILQKITRILMPPLPDTITQEKKEEYTQSFEKMYQKVKNGAMDHVKIEIEIQKRLLENDNNMPPELIKVQESIIKVLSKNQEMIKKEMTIKEAKIALQEEASERILDMEKIKTEALERAQTSGIIFIDEIDKVAVGSRDGSRQDPSKEGVQRDLLPIVEGSMVNSKYGAIKTDHILFIAAGAFHLSKPSDLIPELQGRFPIRVELDSLSEEVMYQILTQTKTSIIKQYQALLSTEDVNLVFEDDALRELARLSYHANQKNEDIGARRLHTTMERVLEEISFDADLHAGKTYTITKNHIQEKLENLVENTDLAKYIL
ncbi:HslU--HslV peptidase ATPase subunit [Helicobacter mustelae]|uniref:Putative heat shock protein n=1 Tax=Helicobacter mustelae (strain ATCC 43772 / CCUG 25715 / CIP 103759 / LMG 18044 / NCTC 12198 / R85-136P) TaxID=679897 RepID=D3UHJ3_HELM1|nr:HslU--HslV peptidase ATPase subunit [Helicobacter mustelae]CBG39965.1 putative heat shock protein [Helicobacter mustelae 12198]SQH71478.1 heat shock protein [Helicobacter mustelae]